MRVPNNRERPLEWPLPNGPHVEPRTRTVRSVSACIVACTLLLVACRADPGSDLVARERAGVIAWTLPRGASMTTATTLARVGDHLTATWEVSTPMTWREYQGSLRSHSPQGYGELKRDDGHVSFARTLPGDEFEVDVAVGSLGPPLRVRATFSARPY